MSKPYTRKAECRHSTRSRKATIKKIQDKNDNSNEDICVISDGNEDVEPGGNNQVVQVKQEDQQDLKCKLSLFDDLVSKKVLSKEKRVQFIESVITYLSSFPAKDFFNHVIKNEIIESARNNEIMFAALFKALNESSKMKKDKREPLTDFSIPSTYFDFTLCEDEQFQEMVHVTRKTAKILIEHIRGIPVDLDNNSEVCALSHNEPIDKMLFLLLWYLRNEDKKLEEAVSMFDLGTLENANRLLDKGIAFILKLKADAGLLWPSPEEFSVAATIIERRFSFPNVAAILGHRIINCANGQRLMLQAVCNEKSMFIDACTSYDTRPRVVFNQSLLKNKIQDLKNGLAIVCDDFSVPNKAKKNMVFPYKEGSVVTSTEEQLFNIMHEFVVGILKDAFNHMLTRFPRLKLLDRCEPDIVTAACVLHNYCIKLNDLTPL